MTKHLAIVGILLPLLAGNAEAQTPTPATARTLIGQLGASINNAGVQQSFDLAFRRPTRAVGATVAATPAGVRAGGWMEVTPVGFLVIKAGAEAGQYFGAFDSLSSFESRLEAFDPDARKTRDTAAAGRTMRLYVAPTLQARVGPIVARSAFSLERWSSSAPGPFFYEPTRDTLLAVSGDFAASATTTVLYQRSLSGGGFLRTGPFHSLMRVHGDALNQVQKLGVVAVHQMSGDHLGLVRPSISLQVGRYLDDPSKAGQWSGGLSVGFSLRK